MNVKKNSMRKKPLIRIFPLLASCYMFSSQTIALIGDVYGRDLDIPGAGWTGHVGVESNDGLIYEMLRNEYVLTEWGVSSELNRNNVANFRSRSAFWGSRYAQALQEAENYYRLRDYVAPNSILAYELGVDYTLTATYSRPEGVIYSDGTRVVTKGLYRCDTFVYDIYATGGIDLDLSVILPLRVYNRFPDVGMQPSLTALESVSSLESFNQSNSINMLNIKFPTLENYLVLSDKQKINLLGDLYNSPNLIGYQENIVTVIQNETSYDFKKELLLLLFHAWQESDKVNAIKNRNEVRLSLLSTIFQDEVTRDIAIRLGVERVLNHEEIELTLIDNSALFSNAQRESILNAYINSSILNGQDPFLNTTVAQDAKEVIGESNVPRRVQSILATWIRMTNDYDLDVFNKPFYHKHLDTPPKKQSTKEYSDWIIAKSALIGENDDRIAFIQNEYQKLDNNDKLLFGKRFPEIIKLVDP